MHPSHLEHRVADLERQVRRSKLIQRTLGALACVVLASSALLQSRYYERLRQLEVFDSQGRTRIVLDTQPTPRLVFKSETGANQIVLGLCGEEHAIPFEQKAPHLAIDGAQSCVLLSVSPAPREEPKGEGVPAESAAFQMKSSPDGPAIQLSVDSAGNVTSELGDEHGK